MKKTFTAGFLFCGLGAGALPCVGDLVRLEGRTYLVQGRTFASNASPPFLLDLLLSP